MNSVRSVVRATTRPSAGAPTKTIRLTLTDAVLEAGIEAVEAYGDEWTSEASLAEEVFRAMIRRLDQTRPASLRSIRFVVYRGSSDKIED